VTVLCLRAVHRKYGAVQIRADTRAVRVHVVIMVALCNRADRYIFILFLSLFFLSSPNLSGRRLDVYHTSAHGVALVRI